MRIMAIIAILAIYAGAYTCILSADEFYINKRRGLTRVVMKLCIDNEQFVYMEGYREYTLTPLYSFTPLYKSLTPRVCRCKD